MTGIHKREKPKDRHTGKTPCLMKAVYEVSVMCRPRNASDCQKTSGNWPWSGSSGFQNAEKNDFYCQGHRLWGPLHIIVPATQPNAFLLSPPLSVACGAPHCNFLGSEDGDHSRPFKVLLPAARPELWRTEHLLQEDGTLGRPFLGDILNEGHLIILFGWRTLKSIPRSLYPVFQHWELLGDTLMLWSHMLLVTLSPPRNTQEAGILSAGSACLCGDWDYTG